MLESLLTNYGYPVLVLGTFFEGETIMLLGGLVAHLGYLSLGWVILAGMCGSLAGNQLWFLLGRRYGQNLVARHPDWQNRFGVVLRRLERNSDLVMVAFPFVYGFRIVTPVAIGMSAVPYWRFLALNTIGVAAWATCIGGAGFLFGQAVEAVLGDIKRYELALIAGVAAIGTIAWLLHFRRQRLKQ